MGSRGMYLNSWTLDFIPENDIPNAVLVWVCLPFLPLHCWNNETIRSIGNTLGKYIDRAEPKDGLQACAWIYVEVDLEKGLPKAINKSTMNNYLSNAKSVMSMVILQSIVPSPPLKPLLNNLNNGNSLKGKNNNTMVITLKPPLPDTSQDLESSNPNSNQDPPRVEPTPLQI